MQHSPMVNLDFKEVFYNFKAGTLFGGKYGTDLTVNYSRAQSIEKTAIDTTGNPDAADLGYKSDFSLWVKKFISKISISKSTINSVKNFE